MVLAINAEETARFGVRCARATNVGREGFAAAMAFCERERVHLLTLRCDVGDIAVAHLAEQAGFLLMDTLVYTSLDLPAPPTAPPAADLRIEIAGLDHVDDVGALSQAAFAAHTGHYHTDPRLPKAQATAALRDWSEKRCRAANTSSPFLIATDAAGLVAFAGLVASGTVEIDCELCAVAPRAQGRGIFRSMIAASARWAAEHGYKRLIYSTHIQNTPALRGVTAMGFRYERACHTFHKWFDV